MARFGFEGVRHDFRIPQGATFVWKFAVTVDGKPGSARLDISGATPWAQIRKTPTSPLAATFGYAIVDGPNGVGLLILTADQASAIPAGATVLADDSQYSWDFKLKLSDGSTIRQIAYGDVSIQPAITSDAA